MSHPGSPARLVRQRESPGPSPALRRTKIKVSGPTQTGGELSHLYSPLPQRSTTSMGVSGRLSETTKERLLQSGQYQYQGSPILYQRRAVQPPGSPYSSKSRTRRLSRERQAAPPVNLNSCEYFTDSDPVGGGESALLWQTPEQDAGNNGKGIRGANSLDSLDTVTNSIQQARANSIQRVEEARRSEEERVGASPRLLRINRSNSVSTRMVSAGGASGDEGQRTFPMRKASEESEYYGIPLQQGRQYSLTQPSSPSSTIRSSRQLYENSRSVPRSYKRSDSRQGDPGPLGDEGHGSLSSLVSLGRLSSVSHQPDDRANLEIQRLRKELQEEHDRVQRLSSQLSTNAHVVSAFEQSLHNMTSRLQHLTVTAEEKDKELQDLHLTIENLSRQRNKIAKGGGGQDRSQSTESLMMQGQQGLISTGTSDSELDEGACPGKRMLSFKKRKSRWLRQSLSKAFSRRRKGALTDERRLNTCEAATSCPGSPSARGHLRSKSASALDEQGEELNIVESLRQQLTRKDYQLTETRLEALSSAHHLHSLRETIGRLRAEVSKLRSENEQLNQYQVTEPREEEAHWQSPARRSPRRSRRNYSSSERDAPKSLTGSPSLSLGRESLRELSMGGGGGGGGGSRRGSPRGLREAEQKSEVSPVKNSNDSSSALTRNGGLADRNGRARQKSGDRRGCSLLQISCSVETDLDEVLVPVSVISSGQQQRNEVKIGHVSISRNSNWVHLDDCLRGLVKTYLTKLDPENQLELTNQSMVCYQCGNIRRVFKSPEPERRPSLLPDTRIWVSFRGGTDRGSIEELAFTSLLPRPTVKQYISTVTKYQRVLLVGPPQVGKSFVAKKLAEFIVLRSGEELTLDSVSVFSCNKATVQQCQDYIAKVTRPSSDSSYRQLPSVVILENIHSQGSKIIQILAKLEEEAPFILCTSNPTEYISDLAQSHQFAEIQMGGDVELLQGFLGRFLRRKMLNLEVSSKLTNFDMPDAIQWLLRVYCNLYIFVKTASATSAFFPPNMFLPCPVDCTGSLRSWFIDLWNSTLVNFLRQVVQQASAEDRLDFEDPVRFVLRTWPWPDQAEGLPQALLKVKTEREGVRRREEEEGDPLMAMLLCLQEATLSREAPTSSFVGTSSLPTPNLVGTPSLSSSDLSAAGKSSGSKREDEEEEED